MPMTSTEISALRHKSLDPQAINKTKTVYCHINLLPVHSGHCKVEIKTPSLTFFFTKSHQQVKYHFHIADIKLVPVVYLSKA